MSDFTFFLFARPSFLEGASRILDFGDTLTEYNRSPDESEAENNALWVDWCAVGDDIDTALGRMAEEDLGSERVEKIGSR